MVGRFTVILSNPSEEAVPDLLKVSIISVLNFLDRDIVINSVAILILLLLSAFFAAIESSFFSLNYLKIKRLKAKGNKIASLVDKLRSRPKELVITFLIGNELVNITASAVMSNLIIKKFGEEYLIFGVITMTLLILTFGEITPKTIGNYYPEKYAFFSARPFWAFYVAITPLRIIFIKFSEYILKKLGLELPVESQKLSVEDLLSIIHAGLEKKIFNEDEKRVIEATLELHETQPTEIMTPRRDIIALPEGLTIKEALEKLKGINYSRIPIYRNSLDNIEGILHVKEIIIEKFKGNLDLKIDNFVKKPIFVPEFSPLLKILKQLQETRIHMAIIVDEHGAVVGLITLQDILTYLVGDINEEKEKVEDKTIRKINKNSWIVSAKLDVETLKNEIGVKLPEDYDFDTVAGLILYILEKLPKENEEFIYSNHKFTILKMDNNRIISVKIEKIPTKEKEEGKKEEDK